MSRYPTPPHSQTDSQSIGLSSYQQRSEHKRTQKQQQPSTVNDPTQQDIQIKRAARTHYELLNSWLHNPADQANKSPPNRTNPRDKLTRLTRQQFQELSTDVYDELCRRIADSEDPQQNSNGAAPFLASRDEFHPKRNQARQKLASLPRSRFKDLASDVFYELERRYPEFLQPDLSTTPSKQNYNTPPPRNKLNQYNPDSQRQPPPSNTPVRPLNPPMNSGNGLITTDMVVPDKSTLVIENNDDAYDDQTISTPDSKLEQPPLRTASIDQIDPRENFHQKTPSAALAQQHSHRPRSGSLSSIKYLSHKRNESDSHNRMNSSGSRVSNTEHEQKISSMQIKILSLEKELRETQLNSSRSNSNSTRLDESQEEISHWKQQCEEQKHQLKTLQASLQEEKKMRFKEAEIAEQSMQDLKRQITDLKQRLETTRSSSSSSRPTSDHDSAVIVERLKAEVVELIDELRQMHSRQDLLLAEQDHFQEIIRDLENSVDVQKRRYETVKTESRDLKPSSTTHGPKEFLPNQKLPLTQNGAIVDIHFTSFSSSIDDLLRSARSNVSNELISVMRRVIDVVSTIDEDIQQYESNPKMYGGLSQAQQESLDSTKTRINATLSNLITASKNHLVSSGLSPISLLDAAASHLCFSMVELVQLVGMRRANDREIELSENYHANRPKYDDDDSNEDGGAQITIGRSNKKNGIPSSPNDHLGIRPLGLRNGDISPAPLRINKDRDFSARNQIGSPKSGIDPQQQDPKSNGFLNSNRTRVPVGGVGTISNHQNNNTIGLRSLNQQEKKGPAGGGALSIGSRTQQMANKFEDLRSPSGFDGSNASDLRDSVSGSSSTNPDKVFDSPPRPTMINRAFRNPPSLPTRHDLDNQPSGIGGRTRSDSASVRTETAPVNSGRDRIGTNDSSDQDHQDVEKLKVYLETQTELIVGSIQSLLSTIRGTGAPSSNGLTTTSTEVDNNLNQIIKIVSEIVDRCSDPSPRFDHSKTQIILTELTENCQKLNQMQQSGFNSNTHNNRLPPNAGNGFSKHVKQAMAAASFGVAKALKELNSHVSGVGEESLL
ncbi:hypothetical protein Pst134EA_000192 [Puccinia striiformis f. sp. tritici]|uniref:hypothetical protein n=2 Tax=Puccinia striiformis f. sp. tritici TaxID=168172 RepID=UPI0020079C7E|nr:hypothetical protein Pst134EA_000192 [Puccinia striiformis f. sp. tritici]KAH9473114.1 hypothetical protein Pst134EA_000192 [Puccinia striiformis f. sp. tritici]